MVALVEIIEAEKLTPLFTIPDEILHDRVQVIVVPLPKEPTMTEAETTAEKIRRFREKYNRETFVEHLKKKLADGSVFAFDAQKIIDGTETEDERQKRYRLEKQA